MAKSIIQARTGPADRECYLCREEAERNGYYGELCHTGLHKHHLAIKMGSFQSPLLFCEREYPRGKSLVKPHITRYLIL